MLPAVKRLHLLALLAPPVLLLALAGCDRNVEPFVPGEQPRPPDLARIFPEAGSGPGANAGPAAAGGMPMGARTGALPPAADEAGAASGETIRGVVQLAPELESAVPPSATLFLIARREGQRGGPPLAVVRVVDPVFPLEFEIGPQNAMIAGMPFTGPIRLSARLDADGNAMTRGASDLHGTAERPYAPGSDRVTLSIDARGG